MSPIRANGIKKDIFAGFIIFFAPRFYVQSTHITL